MASLYPLPRLEDSLASVDIVFVHGLNPSGDKNPQHAFTTWGGTDKDHPGWPLELAAELPYSQVWVLEYDSSATKWFGRSLPLPRLAKNILDELCNQELGTRPLIFIAHSLGGLLSKQLLRHAYDRKSKDWEPIWHQTQGVVFFATPHAGADLATLARILGLALRAGENIPDLQPHSAALEDLAEFYRDHAPNAGIQTLPFAENEPLGVSLIVDHTSANPGLPGVPLRTITADHNELATLVKDRSPFRTVVRFVSNIQKKIITPIQKRPDMGIPSSTDNFYALERISVFEKILNSECKLLIIHGINGVGKTQAVINFCNENKKYFNGGILWLEASSWESLINGITRVNKYISDEIQKFGLKKSILNFLDSFSNTLNSLIVLDNLIVNSNMADSIITPEELLEIVELVVQKSNVIITTNISMISSVFSGYKACVFEFSFLDSKEGELLFRHCLGSMSESFKPIDIAKLVNGKLNGLPLLIVQAANYIKKTGISINDYNIILSSGIWLHRSEFPGGLTSGRSILKVFEKTISAISIESKASLDILKCCAFLNNKNIEIDILCKCLFKMGFSDLDVYNGIETLSKWSICTVRESGFIDIHISIRDIMYFLLKEDSINGGVISSGFVEKNDFDKFSTIVFLTLEKNLPELNTEVFSVYDPSNIINNICHFSRQYEIKYSKDYEYEYIRFLGDMAGFYTCYLGEWSQGDMLFNKIVPYISNVNADDSQNLIRTKIKLLSDFASHLYTGLRSGKIITDKELATNKLIEVYAKVMNIVNAYEIPYVDKAIIYLNYGILCYKESQITLLEAEKNAYIESAINLLSAIDTDLIDNYLISERVFALMGILNVLNGGKKSGYEYFLESIRISYYINNPATVLHRVADLENYVKASGEIDIKVIQFAKNLLKDIQKRKRKEKINTIGIQYEESCNFLSDLIHSHPYQVT